LNLLTPADQLADASSSKNLVSQTGPRVKASTLAFDRAPSDVGLLGLDAIEQAGWISTDEF